MTRIRDVDGRLAGTVVIQKPHLSMSVLATLGAMGDPEHFDRMQSVASACTGARRCTSGSSRRSGRTEVTALGDEVNECARIEASATGGRILASKSLIERLSPDTGAALGLDTNRVAYTQLGELSTATDKARRDAPSIAVCEL